MGIKRKKVTQRKRNKIGVNTLSKERKRDFHPFGKKREALKYNF